MYRRRRRSGVRDDAVRDGRVRDDVELLGGLARRGERHVRVAARPAGDDLDGEGLAGLGRVLLAGARRRDHAVVVDRRVGCTALRAVTRRRTARGKLRALVEALNVLSEELGGAPAAEELLAALSETLAAAQITTPHAEAAFVHAFCRDRSLLLGVEGYALTSLEVALATPPRPDDVVPVAPVPAPPTAVAA